MNPAADMTIAALITITDPHARTTASIAPERGAIVTSFQVAGRELLYLDEATFRDPAKNVRGGIPILFPSPGRLADDVWAREGRSATMKQHGFGRTKPWRVARVESREVLLTLESDAATLAQYPWPFRAELRLTLRGTALRLSMSLENTGDSTMPFGLGYHPYFLVKDKHGARIETDATREFDNLSKVTRAFRGFDLTSQEVDQHLLDHTAHGMPLILADGSRIEVSASDDFGHWVVWALEGSDFICVEPWTSPGNALNTGDHLLTLAPGHRHESFMNIEFVNAQG